MEEVAVWWLWSLEFAWLEGLNSLRPCLFLAGGSPENSPGAEAESGNGEMLSNSNPRNWTSEKILSNLIVSAKPIGNFVVESCQVP